MVFTPRTGCQLVHVLVSLPASAVVHQSGHAAPPSREAFTT
jgi:hypothetical protein